MTKNIPYIAHFDQFGKCTDSFPYNSGVGNRQIRRGNQKLDINNLGQVSVLRRVKSSKRKRDWV